MRLNRRELLIVILSVLVGATGSYAFTRIEIKENKKLTARIITNAIGSMKASNELEESCSEAYSTATACVASLNTCNIEEESKRLDIYNTQRKYAIQKIELINQDLEQIISEVSANR